MKSMGIGYGVALGLVMAWSPVSQALTYVWSGGGSGGIFGAGTAWENAANWVDTAGSPVASYPHLATDIADINRSGTPYYRAGAADAGPLVTTSTAIQVSAVYVGQMYGSNAKLQLGGGFTANQFIFESDGGGFNQGDMGANTIHLVGAGASYQINYIGGSGFTANLSTLRYEGSGTFTPGYAVTYGDVFLGDTADDVITVNSGASIPYFPKRIVFGPGTVHLNGQLLLRHPDTSQVAFEKDPAGIVDGNLASGNGLYAQSNAGQLLGSGVYNCRLQIDGWTAAPVNLMSGPLTVGELAITRGSATSETMDATAANYPLTVLNGFTLGDKGILNMRSASVSFKNVTFSNLNALLQGTSAKVSVSGNWDTSVGTAASLALGTSAVHFTSTGESIRMYAPNAGDHQSFFDVYVDHSGDSIITLLSDAWGNNLYLTYGMPQVNLNGFALHFNNVFVPEPTALALLGVGALALLRRRSRRA